LKFHAAVASRGLYVNSLFTNKLCIFREDSSALILRSGRADLQKLRGFVFKGVKLFLTSGAVGTKQLQKKLLSVGCMFCFPLGQSSVEDILFWPLDVFLFVGCSFSKDIPRRPERQKSYNFFTGGLACPVASVQGYEYAKEYRADPIQVKTRRGCAVCWL